MSSTASLKTRFEQQFRLIPALDGPSQAIVHRIRHEVYCRDLGWEPIKQDGMERDALDSRSISCLLMDHLAGEPVGCTRVIFCNDVSDALPIELSCEQVFDRTIFDPQTVDRATLGEVSRLAVMRNYRQRRGEAETEASVKAEDFVDRGTQARFPFIPVSLYLGATAVARCIGREHILVLTEPRLATHLSRIGFKAKPIGGAIEHRGTRLPSLIRTSDVEANLRTLIKPLYDVILEGVAREFARASQVDKLVTSAKSKRGTADFSRPHAAIGRYGPDGRPAPSAASASARLLPTPSRP